MAPDRTERALIALVAIHTRWARHSGNTDKLRAARAALAEHQAAKLREQATQLEADARVWGGTPA